MAMPTYAKDKNDLPLYTDKIGTERLEIIGGNIVDSAKRVYTYDSAKDELFDDALPPNCVNQPPLGLRVMWPLQPLLPLPVLHQCQRQLLQL
jgi:hypothetical protein